MTSTASTTLARFVANLRYEDLPGELVERTKDYLIDTVGAAIFGGSKPWSAMVLEYARRTAAAGECAVIGRPDRLCAPAAALVNGAFGHAFELDCLIQPGIVVHHGVSVGMPALALAQERRADGRSLITAIAAGTEIMGRIADAATVASGTLCFHLPAQVGVFGGAVAAGRLIGVDAAGIAHAIGISGSLGSGLVEFSMSGGMVKRMHLGRAAEGSVLAACLAAGGYTGPSQVLEGRYGFLEAFCSGAEPDRLVRGLGEKWFGLDTTLKRYPVHSISQVPMALAVQLREAHGLRGDDVATFRLAGNEKMVKQHAIHEPEDLTMAQYSAVFNTAIALHRDPADPRVFDEDTLRDPAIRALARDAQVELRAPRPEDTALASRLTLRLRDGREVSAEASGYRGMSVDPLSRAEVGEKFLRLVEGRPRARAEALLDRLAGLERVDDCGELDLALG